jgi:8-oxo-dGTP diphosphatase
MKTIQVVAAVIERDGKVLCVQRGPHKFSYIHEKWEFPGGKVEGAESNADALQREIYEELELSIQVESHIKTVRHQYPDFCIEMAAYRCRIRGESACVQVRLKEHLAFQWLSPCEIEFDRLDWAAADLPIISALKS